MEAEFIIQVTDRACGWKSKTYKVHSYKKAQRTLRFLKAQYWFHIFRDEHQLWEASGRPTPNDDQ